MNRVLRSFFLFWLSFAAVAALSEGRAPRPLFLAASPAPNLPQERTRPKVDVQSLLREKLSILVETGQVSIDEADEMFRLAFPSASRRSKSHRAQLSAPERDARIKIASPEAFGLSENARIDSGLERGERLAPLIATSVRDDLNSGPFDVVTKAGERLHLIIFAREARTFVRFVGHLAQQVESIEGHSGQEWEMSLIYLNENPEDFSKAFEFVDKQLPPFVFAGLSIDGDAGPPAYRLNPKATATVIVARGGRVVHNFGYSSDAYFAQPHLLGALADAMGVDHETLLAAIAGIPGDQVAARAQAKKDERAVRLSAEQDEGPRPTLDP